MEPLALNISRQNLTGLLEFKNEYLATEQIRLIIFLTSYVSIKIS